MSETHRMNLTKEFKDRSQEWYCPTCGRRMILSWPPNHFHKILDEGDQQAIHIGGTGGVSMGGAEVESHDPYLDPFARFLKKLGL